jgi:hypothetical protein
MSKFNYTLPSGAKFVVNAPPGATQAQADKVFYEQVAAGSLIGYTPGQTLTSVATRLTKFELSRLERGTAGVDTTIVYSISNGSLIVQGASTEISANSTTQTLLSAIENRPVPVSMPALGEVPLTDPVDQGDIVSIRDNDLEPQPVGPLNPYQVQKLLAQTAKLVGQETDQISTNKGIGKYGFTCFALEQAGYVKPGTSIKYFSDGAEDFVSVMSSPSVWTGKGGVYSLNDLLSSSETQNSIQVQIMQQGYKQLVTSGAIVETPRPSVSLAAGQVYTNAGLASVGALTSTGLSGGLNRLVAAGVGSAGINLSTIGSGAINSLLSGNNLSKFNFDSVTQGITNRINGDIGALVINASKFGSQATALWAKSGNLNINSIGASISGLTTGGLGNITGTLAGGFTSLSKNLTNLVPPNLNNLTSSLDVFGKAGSFATNFSNPLSSLNNIGGALQGQATAALTNLQGQATAALTNLQGQATAALGQAQALAGNLSNLSLPTNLFAGAGDLVSGTQVAAGFNNTVNRKTVDAAFNRILGSNKIPSPSYEYPSLPSVSSRLDISQAQNILQDLQGSAGQTFG